MLIFFESNSVPTLFLQKVPNKYYLFDINKKLKMVDLWGCSYMVPPPKDLPFLTYLFEILWFGMIHVCNPFKSLQPYDTHCQLSKTSVLGGGLVYIYIYGQCRNYRTEVEEYEGTVIYRTLLFYNSVFLGRCEKKTYLNLLLTFFVVL